MVKARGPTPGGRGRRADRGRGRRAAPVSRPGEVGRLRGLETVAAQPPRPPEVAQVVKARGPTPGGRGRRAAPVSRPGRGAAYGVSRRLLRNLLDHPEWLRWSRYAGRGVSTSSTDGARVSGGWRGVLGWWGRPCRSCPAGSTSRRCRRGGGRSSSRRGSWRGGGACTAAQGSKVASGRACRPGRTPGCGRGRRSASRGRSRGDAGRVPQEDLLAHRGWWVVSVDGGVGAEVDDGPHADGDAVHGVTRQPAREQLGGECAEPLDHRHALALEV